MQVLRICDFCTFSSPSAFPPCYCSLTFQYPVRRLTYGTFLRFPSRFIGNAALAVTAHLRLMSMIVCLTSGTPGVLAQVALCPATGFAAFDDLLTVAVGTLDRMESKDSALLLFSSRFP